MVDLSVEQALQGIAQRMDEHERRHDREHDEQCRKQDSCSRKFEKLFEATGQSAEADAEHKARINGLTKHEGTQDEQIKALSKKMDKWFIGIIVLAAVGYFINFFFGG